MKEGGEGGRVGWGCILWAIANADMRRLCVFWRTRWILYCAMLFPREACRTSHETLRNDVSAAGGWALSGETGWADGGGGRLESRKQMTR